MDIFSFPFRSLHSNCVGFADLPPAKPLCDQLKSRITDASRLQQKLADVLVEQAVA
ncbi:MAG: hypothetical protein Q7T38_10365 [Gallionella sp.]|nr:hypothetical protein [Gallionella sp.]